MTEQEFIMLPKLELKLVNRMEAAPNGMGQWFVWADDDTQVIVQDFGYGRDYIQFRRYGRVTAEYRLTKQQAATYALLHSLLEEVERHRQKSPYYVRQQSGGNAA